MRYFSEEEVANAPGEHSLLDVPVAIDGVVPLAGKVLVDVGWVIIVDGLDLGERVGTWLSSCCARLLRVRNCSFLVRLNMRQ